MCAVVVLAGGRGRRYGGRDKGLVRYRGRALAERTATALRPFGHVVAVSANRHQTRYRQFADVVVADRIPGFQGPLAGISAALRATGAPRLLVCPCDVVELPSTLPIRLLRALRLHGAADVAVARDDVRRQHLVAALRARIKPGLDAYLAAGGRSVHGWLDTVNVVEVRVHGRLANHNVSPAGGWRG